MPATSALNPGPMSSRRLRVLFAFEQYAGGGFETHLDTLIEALVETGVEVYCIGGADFSRSPARHLVNKYCTTDFQTFSGCTVEACARQIANLVDCEGVDVVHVHPFLSFLPSALGAALAGVPFLATFHGSPDLPLWSSYFGGLFAESLPGYVLPRAAVLSSVSEDARDRLAAAFGIDAATIHVLRNPVNVERYQRGGMAHNHDSRQALLISRLDDDKYQSCASALELFHVLRSEGSHWRFAVAGAGNRESDLRSYARQLNLHEIQWLGHRGDVGMLLRSADVAVGMGRVVLEALSARCVTILAGYDGLVGVVEPAAFGHLQRGNFAGRLMPPVDPLAVARIVKAALEAGNPKADLLREMVSASYGSKGIARAWRELYAQALLAQPSLEDREEARAVMSWLSTVGSNSLRSLQWVCNGATWPVSLLRTPAPAALFLQAMELRSKEGAAHIAEMARLEHRVSELQSQVSSSSAQAIGRAPSGQEQPERPRRLTDLASGLQPQASQAPEASKALSATYEERRPVRAEVADLPERGARAGTGFAGWEPTSEQEERQRMEAERGTGEATAARQQSEQGDEQLTRDLAPLHAELIELKDRQQHLTLESEARDRTIQEYSSRLANAETRSAALAARCEQLSALLDEANRRCRDLEDGAHTAENREGDHGTELTRRDARLDELSTRLVDLQAAVGAQESQLAVLRSALRRAEGIRKLTESRCQQFRTTFEEQLAAYRNQRAWRLMLWCRAAYTLFFSSPLLGKAKFIQFALASLVGRRTLSDYELTFPSLSAYIPKQALEPFIPPAGSADSSQDEASTPFLADPSLPLLPSPVKYDVVILGIIDFDFRFQRPQQLAVQFARAGHRVFWISPTRYLSVSSSRPFEIFDLRENLWEVHLRGHQPDIYMGSLDAAAVRGFQDVLREFYRQVGFVESCVIVQLPFWRTLALGLRASFGSTIAYDCMDDWETFPGIGAFNLAEERLLATEVDVLLVTARKLVEKFEHLGLKPLLVRNAADYESFTRDSGQPAPMDGISGPIVGYFGAIADWVDLDLVYAVAKSRPHYSFVLIGKVFGRDVSRLEALPNVHLLGHREYAEIPSHLRRFDVCIIPFVVNQVTNATDPVKLYEYFSQGKPVVATAMAELEAWRDLIYIARTAAEFAEMLDVAIEKDASQLADRRVAFARSNTWVHRYQAIDEAIIRSFPLVSVLIVTHNSGEFLAPCLDSILKNTVYPNFEIVLVDNDSQDNTPLIVSEYALKYKQVKGFTLPENRGFAGGNNYAAERAGGEYLVFLNADTLVTVGWLEYLIRHFRKDASLGLLNPVTNFAGNEAKINVDYANQVEMEKFAASLAREYSGQMFELEVAALYCAVMPRRLWERVGNLDEGFEIGMFEDDDLSMRVRAAGFHIAAAEDCFVHHFGQGSFSKLDAGEYQRVFQRNRLRYERKWRTTWTAHQSRDGVRPSHEERRFQPHSFCISGPPKPTE